MKQEMKWTIIIKSKTMLRIADIFMLFDSNRNGPIESRRKTKFPTENETVTIFFSSSKRNNIRKSQNRSQKLCEMLLISTEKLLSDDNGLNGSDLFGLWRNLKSIITIPSLMEHNQYTLGNTLYF